MSCGCSNSPCNCQPRPSVCCTPTVESVEYTFENGNLAGIGVFDNDTDNLVQFRGIVSDSAALTVTLNAVDNTIVLAFDDAALVADIPDATTTQRGILETATNAEALAKAATDKILTPSNLAALGATDTFAGLAEFATSAETIAGVSTTLAVTPAGFAAASALVGTVTWADAVARAAATPDFDGQMGTQLDTNIVWVADGTAVGDFNSPMLLMGSADNIIDNLQTTIKLTSNSSVFFSSADATGLVAFDYGVYVQLYGEVDFKFGSEIYADGVIIPANSILTTSVTPGELTSALIADFVSTANTQTGWGTPSSTLARTTFATYAGQAISNPPTQAEVQAIDDALVIVSQRLGAIITDLLAVKLPAA